MIILALKESESRRFDELERDRTDRITDVLMDDRSVLMLGATCAEGSLPKEELGRRMTSVDDWISFSRLLTAGLVEIQEDSFLPTKAGIELRDKLHERAQALNDV